LFFSDNKDKTFFQTHTSTKFRTSNFDIEKMIITFVSVIAIDGFPVVRHDKFRGTKEEPVETFILLYNFKLKKQ